MAVVVLGYHDLAADNDYTSWMKVKIYSFEKQIRALKTIGNFIGPHDLSDPGRVDNSRINLLLTFDDGFINNYRLGYPVIKKYEIPALFFISTSNMETGAPFWFDRVIDPIQQYKLDCVDLRPLGLGSYHFPPGNGESRWSSIQSLLEDVKRADEHQDGVFITAIAEQLQLMGRKAAAGEEPGACLPLGVEHVSEMHRSGLCHFGSHSHRHAILAKLSDPVLQDELISSRNRLEKTLGVPVHHISYPNGDVDDRVQRACMETGYRYGYTTAHGRFDNATDRMRIPRILIGGFDSTPKVVFKVCKALLRSNKGI